MRNCTVFGMISLCSEAGFDRIRLPYAAAAAWARMNWDYLARSQRRYSPSLGATVHCDQWPQHLRGHKDIILRLWGSQIIVTNGHSIWEVTVARTPDNPHYPHCSWYQIARHLGLLERDKWNGTHSSNVGSIQLHNKSWADFCCQMIFRWSSSPQRTT